MIDRILVGTTSADKLREIAQILTGLPVTLVSPHEVGKFPPLLEDRRTFQENACKKALVLSRHFRMPVMAEDAGLEVDCLGGRPGVRSHRYAGPEATDAENNVKLLAELEGTPLENRAARYRSAIALAEPDGVLFVVEGSCEGRIVEQAAGTGGFGYDPLFFYPPLGVTFGQLDARIKNQVSHRAGALGQFRRQLERLFEAPSPSPSSDAASTTGS